LNIAGTVVVGDGTANTGSLSIASGSSGKISLPTAATSKITLAVDGTGGKGSLTFGSYTLNGLASGNVLNGSDAPTPALIGPLGAPTLVLDSGDIAAQFSRGGTTTYLTTTAAAGVAAASGAVTITSVGGNTISASSKLYSTD
jgi:hypothetical protein